MGEDRVVGVVGEVVAVHVVDLNGVVERVPLCSRCV